MSGRAAWNFAGSTLMPQQYSGADCSGRYASVNFSVNVSLTGLSVAFCSASNSCLESGDQLPAEELFGGSSEPMIGMASTTPTMPPIVIVAFAMKVRRLTSSGSVGASCALNGAPAGPWEAPAFESDKFVLPEE